MGVAVNARNVRLAVLVLLLCGMVWLFIAILSLEQHVHPPGVYTFER